MVSSETSMYYPGTKYKMDNLLVKIFSIEDGKFLDSLLFESVKEIYTFLKS
jgi:hypothetical protein